MALLPSPPRKYRRWLLLGAGIVASYAGLTLFGSAGVSELIDKLGEQRRLEERLLDQQARNQRLRQEIAKLESDDRYIERVARTRLGLVRPGEILYLDQPLAANRQR